jgi:Zn-dependent M28 family amino/carboxypeptidase
MLVSGEEKGLLGSEFYTSHPLFPLNKTSVDLNIDMVGRVGEEYKKSKDSLNYIYLIGDDKLSSDLKVISRKANAKFGMKFDGKYNLPDDPNRFYYRSDHYNFAKHGVPILFYFNGVHKDYHQPTDTVDKINFALMSKRTQLVFYTAWEIANMDRMLKRDIPLR